MSSFLARIRNEPALLRGVIASVVLLFGMQVADADLDAIIQVVVLFIPIVQAAATRAKVTPVAKADLAEKAAAERAALEAYRQIEANDE